MWNPQASFMGVLWGYNPQKRPLPFTSSSGDRVTYIYHREHVFPMLGCGLDSSWAWNLMRVFLGLWVLAFPIMSFLLFPVQLNLSHLWELIVEWFVSPHQWCFLEAHGLCALKMVLIPPPWCLHTAAPPHVPRLLARRTLRTCCLQGSVCLRRSGAVLHGAKSLGILH